MGHKGERIGAIDVARSIAILLVVFAHTLYEGRLQHTIYQFHMPLFFVLSGMVLRVPASAQELRAAVCKRAYTCMVPFWIWGIFFMPVRPNRLLRLLYGSWQELIRTETVPALWFLPVLFLASVWCEVLLFAVRNRRYPRLFVPGAAALLFTAGFALPPLWRVGYPFGLDISFVAAGFMLLGYAMLPLLRRLQNPLWGGVGCMACMLGFLAVNQRWQNRVDMAWESYGDVRLFLLCAWLGILAVVGAATVLEKIPGIGRLLCWMGRHTMGIFVLHNSLVEDVAWVTGLAFGSLNSKVPALAVQTVLNLAVCLGITLLLERHLPFALGKGPLPGQDCAP